MRLVGVLVVLMLAASFPSSPQSPTEAGQAKAFPAIKQLNSLTITLIRTQCFGPCPEYAVEIHGDGTVNYCGATYVKQKGAQARKIPETDVLKLVEKFKALNFFSLKGAYTGSITDLPTQLVAISYDGRSKSVRDYAGQAVGMPAGVNELEAMIDDVAATKEWVGDVMKYDPGPKPACFKRFEGRLFYKSFESLGG